MPGPVFGNRIVDLELIVEAFAQLCSPKCFAEKVELFEDSRYGLCFHFTLKCKGFAGAFKLCSTLNLPRLTKTAYKNQEAKLLKVVQEVAEESMTKAATEIVEKQNLSSDIVKCGISVDGTWQRRGYTSMNGCVAAISVDTVLVLATSRANKLAVQWIGPGTILNKISETNYLVEIPGRRETYQIYHINMLKPYYKRPEHVTVIINDETQNSLADQELEIPYLENNSLVYDFEDVIQASAS
ncbi:uncharacterized protein TNCV_4724751 [Trichonephila clavipes]|uniref:Uncharacterized protein n=1 Tax=Trichonephila clavipes TaxID=2585209 RepID=A0A8X6W6R8_TRICX|nr:uncharacterized protein TNCV_4724751 [Trichonephila clavipes]